MAMGSSKVGARSGSDSGLTRESLGSAEGRRRAWAGLMLGDHGALRLFYDNTHVVAPGKMWRTYQPSPAHLAQWKRRGVRTVVNLRGDDPNGYYLLEEEACARLGLALRTFKVYSRDAPSLEVLRGARQLFEEIEYPAVMHCKSGADRAGLMATLFLFFHEGRPLDEAMEQLSFRYGHVRHGKTGIIDRAFERYIAHARAAGGDLSSVDGFFGWAESDYDPAALKRDFAGTWWGNVLTEKVLRRE